MEYVRLGSTGLGHGVALPHGRFSQTQIAIGALIKLEKGVDFDAIDRQPVDLVFGLLAGGLIAWGLIQHIAPAFEFDDLALGIAHGLASSSAAAVSGGLDFANRPAGELRDLAVRLRQEALSSADLIEGVQAIRDKRTPVWPSHGVGKEPMP